jgi:phage terminase Nu1 subunit (DNA packaging protein)
VTGTICAAAAATAVLASMKYSDWLSKPSVQTQRYKGYEDVYKRLEYISCLADGLDDIVNGRGARDCQSFKP